MKGRGKNCKGYTMVEVIISIALIGIIAAAFLTIFTSSYTNIFNMGRKTQTMNHAAQTYMDRVISGESISSIEASDSNVKIYSELDPITGFDLITITVEYPPGKTITLKSLKP